MRQHIAWFVGLGLLALAAIGAAVGSPQNASATDSTTTAGIMTRVSSDGPAVQISRPLQLHDAVLLATRGERSFYRVKRGATYCYGVGVTPAVAPRTVGQLTCSERFPSADAPVLSFSIVELRAGERDFRFLTFEGITADGVATVALLDANGRTALREPVVGNVFSVTRLPKGKLTELRAYDRAGQLVFRQSTKRDT